MSEFPTDDGPELSCWWDMIIRHPTCRIVFPDWNDDGDDDWDGGNGWPGDGDGWGGNGWPSGESGKPKNSPVVGMTSSSRRQESFFLPHVLVMHSIFPKRPQSRGCNLAERHGKRERHHGVVLAVNPQPR